MLYSFCSFISLLILKIFFRIRVSGKENVPGRGAFILASNHASNLDPIVLAAVCPRKLNFMAKEELFRNAFFSVFFIL